MADSAGSIRINGTTVDPPADPRVSLLDLLRETLELHGTKKGCDQGACGACTVLVDGERIVSCLAPAVQYTGRDVVTIEGLAGEHPLQQSFIEQDGFQCGYCTPGQICSAVGMAAELRRGVPSYVTDDLAAGKVALSHDEVRERMSGNLCRCGAHNGIVAATYAELDRRARHHGSRRRRRERDLQRHRQARPRPAADTRQAHVRVVGTVAVR